MVYITLLIIGIFIVSNIKYINFHFKNLELWPSYRVNHFFAIVTKIMSYCAKYANDRESEDTFQKNFEK